MNRIDLHVHTTNSPDGMISPEKIQHLMEKKGLFTVAITDHDRFTRVKNTIPGIEIHTDEVGDVIVLFINEDIRRRSFYEVIDLARAMDAITVLPHPWRSSKFVALEDREKKEVVSRVDAVEVLNGHTSVEKNQMARRFAENNGLKMVAGSDAHISSEIGICGIEISGEPEDLEDVRKAIIKGEYTIYGQEASVSLRYWSILRGKYRRDGISGVLMSASKKFKKGIVKGK